MQGLGDLHVSAFLMPWWLWQPIGRDLGQLMDMERGVYKECDEQMKANFIEEGLQADDGLVLGGDL